MRSPLSCTIRTVKAPLTKLYHFIQKGQEPHVGKLPHIKVSFLDIQNYQGRRKIRLKAGQF